MKIKVTDQELKRLWQNPMNMTGEQKFTIEEIRNYLESQDSFGDVFYFLSAENILKVNKLEEEDDED